MLPKRVLLADVSEAVIRAIDKYKRRRYPCDLSVRATLDTYDFSVHIDVGGVFRRDGRRVLYPRVVGGGYEQNQAAAIQHRAWERYARRRGEFEHYEYPRLLAKLYSDIRSVFLPRREQRGMPGYQTPDSVYGPTGPWTIVPHPPTDYHLEAQTKIERSAAVDKPLGQLLDRLVATIWIVEPRDIRLTYTPSSGK